MKWKEVDEIRRRVSRHEAIAEDLAQAIMGLCDEWDQLEQRLKDARGDYNKLCSHHNQHCACGEIY